MKTLVRYAFLLASLVSIITTVLIYQFFLQPQTSEASEDSVSFSSYYPPRVEPVKLITDNPANCSVARCVSYHACKQGPTLTIRNISRSIKIHSPQFKKLLQAFQNLPNYVANPESETCFTMFNVDVLDRDTLNPASAAVVPDLDLVRSNMKSSQATNYIFVNLFSGTYPDYLEKVDFDVSSGILMKSSATEKNLRTNFDLSFPLLNILKVDPLTSYVHSIHLPSSVTQQSAGQYLATFKGKRYVHGIGSETRDLLPALSNSKDIISVVTCEHNKDEWKKQLGVLELQQCESSIREYHRPEHNYDLLLQNSTFCFVPRGRRLDSFRLREVMRSGCIPVILSNGFALPFAEVLHWSKFAVIIDELRITWISSILRNIPNEVINAMKAQASFVYRTYFSSLDHILRSSLKILYDRVNPEPLPKWIWNTYPGALFVDFDFSTNPKEFPFWLDAHSISGRSSEMDFENMVSVAIVRGPTDSMEMCHNVFRKIPPSLKIVFVSLGLEHRGNIVLGDGTVIKEQLVPSLLHLDTVMDAARSFIFRIDCSSHLSVLSTQVTNIISMTQHFPDRIIGYNTLTHVRKASQNDAELYSITSDTTSNYSVVELSLSVHHKYYYFLLRKFFNESVISHLSESPDCFSIFFNMFVSHVTLNPPIALHNERNQEKSEEHLTEAASPSSVKHAACLSWFRGVLGHMPLKHSSLIYASKR